MPNLASKSQSLTNLAFNEFNDRIKPPKLIQEIWQQTKFSHA
jgi:hypothetical protein